MSREEVQGKIQAIGENPKNPNPALAAASVYSIGESGRQYEISTTETNRLIVEVTAPQAASKSIDKLTR